ncbi:NAD(P)H-quinone oxidoreductase subunit 5 [Fodinibius salinus]|uniref:NAD(P)H-quinone oxidoreductase subunit 5 n=2 Tax=Fodinibius salinus TaxID=860790 RepID=A0A5D3YGC6_9BACT|nr:NAD(P)H-quinone oxidoreductase subunit 5 [Fodinibius salinus]
MISKSTSESLRTKNRTFTKTIVRLSWFLFTLFFILLGISYFHPIHWTANSLIMVDQLSLVMSTAVTLFSSIVLSYSGRYLAGYAYLPKFMLNGLLFSFAVILMVISNHIALFITAWLCMGLLMAKLIGEYTHTEESVGSKRTARNYFLMSAFFLSAGFIWLGYTTGFWHITNIVEASASADPSIIKLGGILLIIAAIIQSALFPFHRWLMSSMTAPTPASALMHAGFVNAGAVLLARVAPILFGSHLLWILVIAGGIGALIGKFSKFMQPNVKQKLACSTTAQMGFMLLECGLGFFAAAITHLILHGFYKAYLFLSSGDAIEQKPVISNEKESWNKWHLPVMLLSGAVGGLIFAFTTGKGLHLDSGLFLNLVIVLTVIHGSRDILKHSSLSRTTRLVTLPAIIIPALLVYAVVFELIDTLLTTIPMIQVATPLSWAQIFIGVLYLISFIVIELKLYKKSSRLYVYMLNVSQPKSNTILH